MTALTSQPTIAGTVSIYRMSTSDHEFPWGLRAIDLLTEKGIKFEDIELRSREEVDVFKAKYGGSPRLSMIN